MARLPPLDPATFDDDQRAVYQALLDGPFKGIRGPHTVWLRRAGLAAGASGLGEYFQFGSSLPKRLSEIAILVVARACTAQFVWSVHRQWALDAGVPEAAIDSIANDALPAFDQPLDAIVYRTAKALVTDSRLDDATYAHALDALGEKRLVDLVATVGYYVFLSFSLNTFQVDPKPGAIPLPPRN